MLYIAYGALAFERGEYHPEIHYGIFYNLYILSLMFSLFYLFFFGVVKKSIPFAWAILLMLILLVLSFSISTRITGVLFVVAAMYLWYLKRRRLSVIFAIIGIISVLLASYFRNLPEHGLFNYLGLFDINGVLELVGAFLSYGFNFSFYLSIATAETYIDKVPIFQDFVIMLNPLPGVLAGWYGDMQTRFLVQHNVPAGSWGILWALGLEASLLCMVFIAFIVAFLDEAPIKEGQKFIVMVFGAIFVVFFAQYTLRSAFRFIWYAIVFIGCIGFLKNIKGSHAWKIEN